MFVAQVRFGIFTSFDMSFADTNIYSRHCLKA